MYLRTAIAALVPLAIVAACSQRPAIDEVPVGSDVQLTREDGALVEGRLTERDAKVVKVDVGPRTRSVPRAEIADVRVKDATHPADLPKAAKFREVSVPEETRLAIRIGSTLSSATSAVETPLHGELAEPLVIDGVTVAPAGSDVRGVVSQAQASGKVKGRATLALHFDTLTVGSTAYPIDARFARTAEPSTTSDAKKIGIPAAGGAIVGAIIGGKKGAAIGAAAGGGAGTAVVLSTPGKEVVLDEGTVLSLAAGRDLIVRVPLS